MKSAGAVRGSGAVLPRPSRPAAGRFSRLRPLPLAAAALLAVLALSCGGDGSPAPAPSVLLPGSPAVTDPPVDLGRADALYRDGLLDEAIQIYSAAVRHGDGGQRRQALGMLSRIQHERGDLKAAVDTARALLAEPVAPEQERQSLLLLGMAAFKQGDNSQAQEALSDYLAAGGPAASYARLALAEIAARQGRPEEAGGAAEEALLDPLPAIVRTRVRFDLAGYYEDAGRTPDALALYERISADAAAETDRAEALWQLARLAERSGRTAEAVRAVRTLVRGFPWHWRALEALDGPLAAAADIGAWERALVLFRNRSNSAATQEFAAIAAVAEPATAGWAHYYLGILAERAGDPQGALSEYDRAISLLAGAGDAAGVGQAYWDRATVLETAGRTDEAVQSYVSAADAAPGLEDAPGGLFRAAVLRLKQGRPGDAAALWQRYLGLEATADARAAGHFWLAKAALAMGQEAAAIEHLRSAVSASPLDYYGLRAQALLQGESPAPAAARFDASGPGWAAVERDLVAAVAQEPVLEREALFRGVAWQRAVELLRAGLRQEAEDEFEELVSRSRDEPWLLYRLARVLRDEGLFSLSARGGSRLTGAVSLPGAALLSLAYPTAYLEPASAAAGDEGLSPLLLLALVRQESMYEPDAVSPAGAMGLTQVMPGTAAEIARDLGEDGFRRSDLLRPPVSLRFGAYYLGSQVQAFGGDASAALAAYNGGPGNGWRWREAAGRDPDLFLESIDFKETRAYVELVLENYAMYLYAYGVLPGPVLALE